MLLYLIRIEKSFTTVFWSLFGMADHTSVTLTSPDGDTGYQGGFTERLGYFVFGTYNYAAVIVLLNMLISMMTRSFDIIQVGYVA